ncbi:hypothetical protein V6N13_015999 [Hibiscus sabdariffa]
MEGGDIYRAGSHLRRSLRSGSSSAWRNNDLEAFSRSIRDDDDEEALMWAALEKLPTVSRLRKGILTSSEGGADEIDVYDLGWQQRRALLERLVKVAEEDNEKFLLKLKNRIARVGIVFPTIEIRFEHLNIEAQAFVGTSALPTVLNFTTSIFEGFLNYIGILSSRKKKLTILNDVSGIIKPGRMTLLLGPPSSGKTTLLLALAGKLDPALKCSGTVTYNGHSMDEFVPQRTAAYISQHDLHIGEMTVRETLAFSARCQGVGDRYYMLEELLRREKQANIKPDPDMDVYMKAVATEGQEANVITDYIIKILGLEVCADTMVGDEMLRGISGGQRKRVTTGEMMIVYQGPREHVLSFFEYMGFKCPERKGVADFLQEVTSRKDQKQYWVHKDQPYREYLLMKRNSFVYIFKFIQLTMTAFITMTLFLRTEMRHDSIRDLLFYPSWAYALPTWILKIPISFAEVSIWVFLTYYVIGFDPNVERLFKQYLILVLVNQMASGLFRFIAAAGRNMVVANTFGAFALLILFALGGFVLSREDIKKWWIWGYWISPMMYGQNALMVNEFLGNQWRRVLPGSNESLGITVLKSRGFFQDPNWYWFGVGGLLGFIVLFNFFYTLALAYLKPLESNRAVISEKPEENKQANGVGGKIQLSNKGRSSSNATRSEVTTVNKKKGMVLPFEPHSITFDDIIYSVDMPLEIKEQGANEDKLVLLKGVSGSFRPGVLTALMGVSGAEVGAETRKMFIDEVMDLVELNPIRHAQVGLPGVNGLDARAAAIVMRTVRNTVDTGRTVVCTIHQPSIDIFEAFDELFLMKRGGQEIYVGPLGHHSKHLIDYFEGIEGVSKIKDGYNPATWMLEVSTTAQELALGVDFADIYKKSDLYRRNKALIEDLSKPAPVIALMFGTLFWDLGTKTKRRQDLANAMGSMYAAVLFLGIQNAASVQPVVAVERTVFYRERAAGMYSAMPYAIAQVLIEIPYIFVQAAMYGLIVHCFLCILWNVECVLRIHHPKTENSNMVEMNQVLSLLDLPTETKMNNPLHGCVRLTNTQAAST